jgi:hypothetical protein
LIIKLTRNTPPGYKRPVYSNTDPKHPKNKLYLILAKKFYRILKANKKLNPKTKLDEITKEFRLICEVDLKRNGFDIIESRKKLVTALAFYKKYCGDAYIPLAFSGSSFRHKFNKMEAAIARSDENWDTKKKSFMANTDFKYDDGIVIDQE